MSFDPLIIKADLLREFTAEVFLSLGVPEAEARISADILIESDLRGFESHGVARLFPCFNRIRKGLIATEPAIEITWLSPTTGCCDGGNGLGMVVGYRAMQACLQRAALHGSAFLTVRHSKPFRDRRILHLHGLGRKHDRHRHDQRLPPGGPPPAGPPESWGPTPSAWASPGRASSPFSWTCPPARSPAGR